MSSNSSQESSSETVTVYTECLKHSRTCKKFVTNADKSSLESVFCICGCYIKDHRKVELPLRPTNPSSSTAAVASTVLPPPPPPPTQPQPQPQPQPRPRPLIVYVRRSVSTASGIKEEREKEEEDVVVERELVFGERKKRVRTTFSAVQKEKIREYAERVEWRVLKKDEDDMIRFCDEIGITPDMCKNWITNNKKRLSQPSTTLSL